MARREEGRGGEGAISTLNGNLEVVAEYYVGREGMEEEREVTEVKGMVLELEDEQGRRAVRTHF